MKCKKCGTILNNGANFCRVCGLQVDSNNDHSGNISEKDSSAKFEETKIEKIPNLKTKNLVDGVNSSEIKKIFNEMKNDEQLSGEPTMAIPTDLINKYCKKKNDNSFMSDKLNESNNDKKDEVISNVNLLSAGEEKSLSEINLSNMNNSFLEEKKSNDSNLNKKSFVETKNFKKKNDILSAVELEEDKSVNHTTNETSNKSYDEKDKAKSEENYNYKNDENKHYGRNFLVFFIILVCVCAIGYLIYVLSNSQNELEKMNREKVSLQEEINSIKNNSSNNENGTSGVIFHGYKFSTITSNYTISNDSLVINLNNSNYIIKINNNLDFDSLKNKKDLYRQQLVNDGYNILSYGNKHIDEIDYYVFAVSNKNQEKKLIAYSKLDESSVIAFIISNSDNTINYELLNNTNLIISSISKSAANDVQDLDIFIEKK